MDSYIPATDSYRFYNSDENYEIMLHIFSFDSEIKISIDELRGIRDEAVTPDTLLRGCVFYYKDIMFNSNALLFIDGIYHLYATNRTDIGYKLNKYGKTTGDKKCNIGEPVVCGSVMNDDGIYYQKEYYKIKIPA